MVKRSDEYRAGMAAATARLIGVVGAELGHRHQLLDRMLIAVGELYGATYEEEPDGEARVHDDPARRDRGAV